MLTHRLVLSALLACACMAQSAPPSPSSIRLEDIAKRAGLRVPHLSTLEKKYILESMSGGVGFIDCDNDGKLDIVTTNGSTVERFLKGGDPMVTLYHQDAGLKFMDITESAGLTRKGWGMGVAVADFDNDGWQDLYVTGYEGNVLYRNLGNCRFEDVTEKVGLRGGGFSVGAAWADYDRDGFVDLFVARYVHLDIHHLPEFGGKDGSCAFQNVKVQCGPSGLPSETNLLFHNRGDGTFEEVSLKAGVANPCGDYGLQPIWFDYDNDGWPDLFVANDVGANYLYHNKGGGQFEDVSLLSGTALDESGKARGSMGVDAADFSLDGRLSLFVTTFSRQPDALYWNRGNLGFADMAAAAHLAKATYPYVGWGTSFVDFDNDGWPDLLVVNGHVYPQADVIPGMGHYREPIQLFRNRRDRSFEEVTASSGLADLPLLSRRGAAFGDINNTGKMDALILNEDGPPTLLLNISADSNHAALFQLIGTKSNKSAIGARVTVIAGDLKELEEVRGGSSYLSQNDLRLHFGLGSHTSMDRVEVVWPSGWKENFEQLPADYVYTFVEGHGIQKKTPFPTP
jgi:enediyne biosynthesis protein E4